MITTSRTLAVLAAAAAAVSLTACTKTLDSDELQTELRDQLSEQAGVDPADVSVSCPEDVEVEQGREFDCELTAPNGDKVRVVVTLTDDEGTFTATVPPQQFEEGGSDSGS